MKIALIIEHFDPLRGAAEHLAVWLASHLALRGHDVHVICHDVRRRSDALRAAHRGASFDAAQSAGSNQHEAPLPPGVQIHALKGPPFTNPLGQRLFGQRARRWCQQHRPAVVHSLSVAVPGDIYHPEFGLLAEMHRQALAAREADPDSEIRKWFGRLSPRQQAKITLEKKALAPRDRGGPWRVICMSDMLAAQVREHYHLEPQRLVLLPNPAPDDGLSAADRQELRVSLRGHYRLAASDRVALFVGHDFARKGLKYAIEAVARTQTPWKLLVIGQGKLRPFYEQVEDQRLEDRVRFLGPTRQMTQMYAAADALILPTFYDPVGQVATEALSHGLPVVSTKNLGCASRIAAQNAGAIVESPRHTQALAHALDNLAGAKGDVAGRAKAAARTMDAEAYLDRVVALYEAFGRGGGNAKRET